MKQKNNNQKRRLNMEAPLLDDYIFKRTFTKQGTEPLLKDFLEAILEKKINKVEVKNNEIPKGKIEEKASVLDIRVEVDDKQIIDVEMQVDDRKDLKQRGPLYMCKNISTQIDKGNDYTILKPSIAIWILNFNYFKVNSYHSVARMMFDKEKSKYVDMGYKEEEKTATDMLEMHFIEMPKFLKKNPGIENKLDQWLWLISGKGDKIKMVEEKNRNIKEALERVDEVMQDPEVMELYFNMAVSKWDYNSGMQYGKEEGKKEGRLEEKIKIAKKLKNKNIPIESIMEITELTREEIENL